MLRRGEATIKAKQTVLKCLGGSPMRKPLFQGEKKGLAEKRKKKELSASGKTRPCLKEIKKDQNSGKKAPFKKEH